VILRQEAHQSGACGYLVKGCRPETLFDTMRGAIAGREGQEARPSPLSA